MRRPEYSRPTVKTMAFDTVQHTGMKLAGLVLIAALASLLFLITYASAGSPDPSTNRPATTFVIPLELLDQIDSLPGNLSSLPNVPIPEDNRQNPAKIELGKLLFFDQQLSFDRSMSCATCHDPNHGFADGRARAVGFGGKELGRHSPTILNAAYNSAQFWDGRAPSLEEQAKGPILADAEMGMPDIKTVLSRIRAVPEYHKLFKQAFLGEENPINYDNVGKAIAAFERTIITPDSRFDQYMRGNKQSLTDQEKKGLILFISKASCAQCHSDSNFTDNKFHNLGVPQKGPLAVDLGRYAVTKDKEDKGAFKTPTIRNITETAPYMHDGVFQTLEEVIDFYDQGGGTSPNKSKKLHKLNLTKQEKEDLIAFLRTLSGKYPQVSSSKLS